MEKIVFDNKVFAIIINQEYKAKGVDFITDPQNSLQLAVMSHQHGHKIKPHFHNKIKREIHDTQEVILVKSGKVKVNFYSNENRLVVASKVLSPGDLVLLIDGAHGFEILEDADIIEIKQGPYLGEFDKVKYDE